MLSMGLDLYSFGLRLNLDELVSKYPELSNVVHKLLANRSIPVTKSNLLQAAFARQAETLVIGRWRKQLVELREVLVEHLEQPTGFELMKLDSTPKLDSMLG